MVEKAMQITQEEMEQLVEQWGGNPSNVSAPNDIVDAYQEGKKNGVKRYMQWLDHEQKQKLLAAMKNSTQMIIDLERNLKISINAAYLGQFVSDDKCFHKTIFVLDTNHYLSDVASKAYKILIEKSQELRKKNELNIDFALIPAKRINNQLLQADGFQYRYVKETESRAA